jgi:hypothetical protein
MSQSNFFAKMAERLHVSEAELTAAMREAQREGKIEIKEHVDWAVLGRQAAAQVGAYIDGKVPYAEVPGALSGLFIGLATRAELTYVPPEERPDRPQIDGLPESLFLMLEADARYPEMAGAKVNREQYRYLGERILIGRAVVEALETARDWAYSDLVVAERKGADLLMADHERVESDARRNPMLLSALEGVSEYLKGRFRKGAETRAQHKALREQVTSTVGKTAKAEGQEEGRNQALAQFKALLERFGGAGAKPDKP